MEAKRAYMCKERIVDLEFKISRLGLLGKAYYDLVQIKLKRHRNQISIARTQNMLLHAALDTLRHKARIARKNLGDLESLRKTVASLRVTYDHQRKLVFSRQKKLEAQVTDTHSAEIECAAVLDPNTPDLVRIRRLEAMLNAIRLKTKDVQILTRHYEATLKPMKDEYTSYSAKLEAVQNILNIKNVECERLVNTQHDAIRARDASKKELEELIGTLFGKDGRDLVSPELQNKILAAIKEIKDVMEVRSMREMYHQFLLQEKQSAYLESIYVELKRTVDQLKNDYPPRATELTFASFKQRRSSMQPHAVRHMIEGTKNMVRRQSSRRGSIPLLQILDGTQKLVERLHEGNITMPTEEGKVKEVLINCQEKISNLMQAVHRKMKLMQKETHRKAKEDAEAAGPEYVREARFAELDAEDDARKAAKEKHTADIQRELAAREAEARKKEEEALAAREERRAQVREEMGKIRERSRKEAEAQAEALRKWQKEHEPARSSRSTASSSAGAPRGKIIKTAENVKDAVERSAHAPGGGSPAEPDHKRQETPETPEVSSIERRAETEAKTENDPAKQDQASTSEKTEEYPPMAEKGESPDVAVPSSTPSEAQEEVRMAAVPSTTEPQVQPAVTLSSPEQGAEMSPQARGSQVRVTFTATGAEAGELRVNLLDAIATTEDESRLVEGATTAVTVPSTPPSSTEPQVQQAVAPSSPGQAAEMSPQESGSRVRVTLTGTGAEAGELPVNLQAALATTEDEASLVEGPPTAVTVPSTPKQPEVQPPARSSSSQHGATEETASGE